jgi:hypothetical protein
LRIGRLKAGRRCSTSSWSSSWQRSYTMHAEDFVSELLKVAKLKLDGIISRASGCRHQINTNVFESSGVRAGATRTAQTVAAATVEVVERKSWLRVTQDGATARAAADAKAAAQRRTAVPAPRLTLAPRLTPAPAPAPAPSKVVDEMRGEAGSSRSSRSSGSSCAAAGSSWLAAARSRQPGSQPSQPASSSQPASCVHAGPASA